jgi:phenylalanyl-tRNA synthetase beta chain
MRVPVSWLAEWIDLPPSMEELAERLTLGGLEIEEIERGGPDLSGVRIGHVLSCERHPNADRLSLCRVDLGDGEPLDIVCGASNVAAGQRVPVAPPGTVMPDGQKLKKAKIRGVTSHGMICSERELGIGEDADGILVLGADAPIGAPLEQVVGGGADVLDIAIPPNRGDTASMIGVAREVRAHFGGEVRVPACDPPESDRATVEDARIEIDDPDGCYAYVARVVRGVSVGPSPEPLRRKLEAAGVRAISLPVDVTNLVLLEFGQPIHAFDLSTLRGGLIRVRRATAGERLRLLDGQERALAAEDLVIADAERSIALAGVMGGADTEVGEGTTDILIESAHFHPSSIRRTARRLGLQTEASYRFERGVDREGIARAADRAALLMAELGGGRVSRERIEVRGIPPQVTEEVLLEAGRVNRLLGTDLDDSDVVGFLDRVGVACEADPGHVLRCRIPSHRNDLERPQDLIEEVARTFGCDRIPETLPVAELRAVELPVEYRMAEQARESLRAAGLLETLNVPFVSPGDMDRLRLPEDDPRRTLVAIENPMVEEESGLRSLLAPTLLEVAHRNRSRQVDRVALFEVARVFRPRSGDALPEEPLHVAGILVRGEDRGLWEPKERSPLFYEAKGIVERLVEDLERAPEFPARSTEPFLHPQAACGVAAGNRLVGFVGQIHPEVAAAFEIDAPCALLELDLGALLAAPARSRVYREVSRQPRVRRDLAVLVDRERPAGEILEAIRKAGGSILLEVDIFDRYEGRGVPDGKVSLAFRLVFQRADRTLTDAEVTKQTERIVGALVKRFGATLR